MVSFPLFLLAVIWLLYKLFSEKPCPPGHMYDIEKANEDMFNGISYEERQRRKKRGEYWSPQSEVYDKRKTKELNEYCKKILYQYAKGYSTFYQSAWDSYKNRFKNNKDSKGNLLPLDEEALFILFSFEKQCLTHFHIQKANYQNEIAALNNKHSDEATVERIRKEKWLTYYEQGIKDLYKELEMSEKDDPNIQNCSAESNSISEPVEQNEDNSSQCEQQNTEVERQSKFAMDFQIADDIGKNGTFLKNRCAQILELYGFENSKLQMDSDCWKLITCKSNRKYGLTLKLPNYRQYDISSASVFIYCVEAMCNIDLTNIGKSIAENLQIQNDISAEDIKLEYTHTRLFFEFDELSPFSHKMHGVQGGIRYRNKIYSLKCGIEMLNDNEFILSEIPQEPFSDTSIPPHLPTIQNSANEQVDASQTNSSNCPIKETVLTKKCMQLLDEYGFEDVSAKAMEDGNTSYRYIHVSANKDNRKYAVDIHPEVHVPAICVHEVLFDCLSALCGIDIVYAEATFCSQLKTMGMNNINFNASIRTLAMTLFHPSLCIIGTAYHDGHKYRIQCFIELLDGEEQSINICGGRLCSEENSDVPHELVSSTVQSDFDSMNGHEFENFCANILRKNGYVDVTVTRGSGDQGVDIIAYKDDVKYGIQCKCYASDVGNKAVQEVFSGKAFYNCHVGVVLTNSYFTHSAIELAQSNGVVLWNRDKLLQMIESANCRRRN